MAQCYVSEPCQPGIKAGWTEAGCGEQLSWGREAALAKLRELAGTSTNQFFAMHLPTKEIVARTEGTKKT